MRVLIVLLLLTCTLHAQGPAGRSLLVHGTKAVTSAGTAVALVASDSYVDSVTIQARKNTTTANTGNVYVGTVAAQALVLGTGQSVTLIAADGKKLNLADIYIDAATSADAVNYTALK